MRILRIKATGFRKLEPGFTLDFIPVKTPRNSMYDNELNFLFKNVYCPICYTFIGGNGQGKTSTLALISLCYDLLLENKVVYRSLDFSGSQIELEIVFFEKGKIYKYGCILLRPVEERFHVAYCKVERLYLTYKTVNKVKHSTVNKGVFRNVKSETLKIEDAPLVFRLTQLSKHEIMNLICKYYDCIEKDTFLEIIRMFGFPVECLKCSEDKNYIFIKCYGKLYKFTLSEMTEIISFGTIRGILLFMMGYFVLKFGGVLIVDELESSINMPIVYNFINLFLDSSTNTKGATVYCSTYQGTVLDIFHRSDNIYYLRKNELGYVSVKQLLEVIGNHIRGYKSKIITKIKDFDNKSYKISQKLIQLIRYK